MPNQVTKSKIFDGEGLCVWFGNEHNKEMYYAWGINKQGSSEEPFADMGSMWHWIMHMRSKVWFTPTLEESFIQEVRKYIK